MLKVNHNSWNHGVTLLWGNFQYLKKHQTYKNTWSDIIFTNVLGKKTYNQIYAKEEINPNPLASVPEAITGIEIIYSKPMMHIWHMYQDTQTYTGHVQWMLNISSPDSISHLIFRIATLKPNQKLVSSRKDCWLELFGTQYLTDTDAGNIWQPLMCPPTHKHTHGVTMYQEYYVFWCKSFWLSSK
jgi:hypothetical protein